MEYCISLLTEIDRDFVDHFKHRQHDLNGRLLALQIDTDNVAVIIVFRLFEIIFAVFHCDCYRLVRPRRRSHDQPARQAYV